MLRTFIIFFAVLSSYGTAFAQEVHVTYEDLKSVLSGYHSMPEADYWERLDHESTKQNLLRLSVDESVVTVIRARAIIALTHFMDEDVFARIVKRATEDPKAYIRSSAVEAIARSRAGKKAMKHLGDALSDNDVMVRLTSMRALRKAGTPEALGMLRKRLESESNRTARSVIEKSLEQAHEVQ